MSVSPGLHRRDLFKLGAFTAAAAGVTALIAPAVAQDPGEPRDDGWRVAIDIPGAPEAGKTALGVEIDPLAVEVRAHGPKKAGGQAFRVFGPGAAHWGNARLTGALTAGAAKELHAWFQAAVQGTNIRRSISIVFGRDKGEQRTFNLLDCFPVSFGTVDMAAEGNAGAVMHWTLEVRVDRIEMA